MGSRTTKYIPALKYDWLTGLYDRVVQLTMPERRFKTALIEQADIREHHRVLDFGAGTATLSLLAKQHAPGSEITGVDVDEKVIAIAKQKIAAAKLDIGIDRYDGVKLPYPDGHFDRVVSSLVFHHLTQQQKTDALKEIRRALKPGGELHIADWGRARNLPMRLLFLLVQMLDGFETTGDNVRGLLPSYIESAGFVDARETKTFSTMFGTLSLYRARSSSDAAQGRRP